MINKLHLPPSFFLLKLNFLSSKLGLVKEDLRESSALNADD